MFFLHLFATPAKSLAHYCFFILNMSVEKNIEDKMTSAKNVIFVCYADDDRNQDDMPAWD